MRFIKRKVLIDSYRGEHLPFKKENKHHISWFFIQHCSIFYLVIDNLAFKRKYDIEISEFSRNAEIKFNSLDLSYLLDLSDSERILEHLELIQQRHFLSDNQSVLFSHEYPSLLYKTYDHYERIHLVQRVTLSFLCLREFSDSHNICSICQFCSD